MKIYAADKSELMQVTKVERQGDNLVLKGKVFGTMPMAATLTPEEARAFRKLLTPKLAWLLITLPFRKGSVWALTFSEGRLLEMAYIPPPDMSADEVISVPA